MKILCLHGVGSSGEILEAQMVNLRRELDPSFELVFIDGSFECERGPGIPEYQSGPFFSHTESYSPVHMAQAVTYLSDLLGEEGPFDGIFGFSQGAALALSYSYQYQSSSEALPIKFAVLFSTAMPCSPDPHLGDAIISRLRDLEYNIVTRVPCANKHAALTATEQDFVGVLQRTILDAHNNNMLMPNIDMDVYRNGEMEAIPRVMYPDLLAQKIQLPTVHVWGNNDVDFMVKMAEVAYSICDEDKTKMVKHDGAHDVPKKPADIKVVMRALEWAMARG